VAPRARRGIDYKDEAKGRWYAAVSSGYRPDGKTWRRQKVSGRTRAEVAAKLRELHAEHDAGAQLASGYTVHQAVDDWLAEGLYTGELKTFGGIAVPTRHRIRCRLEDGTADMTTDYITIDIPNVEYRAS
jgi:hypothetical protein